MKSTDIYLFFNGNAEEAFKFYETVFDSKGTYSRFGDAPDGGPSEKDKDLIMNVSLPIGPNNILMGCDNPSVSPAVLMGNNFNVIANASSKEEAKTVFEKLSANGKIIMPLEDTFWGAYFGMLKDQFGISWMVSFSK